MTTVTVNSPVRCNRCSCKFNAPKEMVRSLFAGQRAARIENFCTCPECNQTDCHWVYASDVAPEFTIEVPETLSPEFHQKFIENKRKKLTQSWLEQN
jgi:hypothetical protein